MNGLSAAVRASHKRLLPRIMPAVPLLVRTGREGGRQLVHRGQATDRQAALQSQGFSGTGHGVRRGASSFDADMSAKLGWDMITKAHTPSGRE